jgi:hypothetical protein
MKKSDLEIVKDRIYELVPELKEVSSGCLVKHKMLNEEKVIALYNKIKPISYLLCDRGSYEGMVDRYYFEAWYEVLGHPIQLHHVLQAVKKIAGEEYEYFCIDYDGNFFGDVHGNYGYVWNLSKDLDGQNSKAIKFLKTILCQNKKI